MMEEDQIEVPSSPQMVSCLFCQAGVRRIKFQSHISDVHQVFFDHSLIFKLNELGKKALERMVERELNGREVYEVETENLASTSTKNILLEKYLEARFGKVNTNKVKEEKSEADIKKEIEDFNPQIHIRKIKEENGVDRVCNERNKVVTVNENDMFDPGFGESSNITISVTECNKQFASKINLIRHQKIHSGERDFTCEECPQKFSRKDRLFRHKKIHTGEKFSCTQCDKSYAKKDGLNKHMKQHPEIDSLRDEGINKSEGDSTLTNVSYQIYSNVDKENDSDSMDDESEKVNVPNMEEDQIESVVENESDSNTIEESERKVDVPNMEKEQIESDLESKSGSDSIEEDYVSNQPNANDHPEEEYRSIEEHVKRVN